MKIKRIKRLIESLNESEIRQLNRVLNEDPKGENIKENLNLKGKRLFESKYTRLADTDEQEQAIEQVERWMNKVGKKGWGGTKIGKYPQTVILDVLRYQGSDVYIYMDGIVKAANKEVGDNFEFYDALGIDRSKLTDEDQEFLGDSYEENNDEDDE